MKIAKDIHPMIISFMLLVTLGVFLMLHFMPYAFDDLTYQAPFKMKGIDWATCRETWKDRWLIDNCRLANVSAPLTMVLLPKIVINLLSGAVWFMVMLLCYKIARLRKDDVLLSALLIAGLITLLPWHDGMLTVDCQLNYTWSIAACLGVLYLFINPQPTTNLTLLGIFSLLAGSMHEGASVPLCVGLATHMAINYKQIDKRQIVILLCLGIGTALLFTSPGIWNRNQVMQEGTKYSLSGITGLLIKHNTALLLLLIALVWFAIARRRNEIKEKLASPFIIVLTTALASFSIHLYTMSGSRISWFTQTYALVALCMLLQGKWGNTRWNRTLSTAIILGLLLHLTVATHWVKVTGDDFIKIGQIYTKGENGQIYYPVKTYSDIPLLALRKPHTSFFNDENEIEAFMAYFGDKDKGYPRVIPVQLKNIDFNQCKIIAGTAQMRIHGQYLICVGDGNKFQKLQMDFNYKKSGHKSLPVHMTPFVNDLGQHLYYCEPRNNLFQQLFDQLVSINAIN